MEVCPDLWVSFYAPDPGQATVNKYSMERPAAGLCDATLADDSAYESGHGRIPELQRMVWFVNGIWV